MVPPADPADAPTRAYGTWPSPITPELVVAASVSLGEIHVGVDGLWWSELRPEEGGRVQIVRHRPGDTPVEGHEATVGLAGQDVLPEGFSARTRVHEYGGGAWWLHLDTLFFTNWDDQRLHRYDAAPDARPVALTPEPAAPGADRYADGRVTPDGEHVVCVRERHHDGAVANELVALPAHPRPDGPPEPTVLVSGPDFVAAPRPSPDGRQLCWYQWDDPDLPWDATELWVADLVRDGDDLTVARGRRVAGGRSGAPGGGPESIIQPGWDGAGRLLALSDRDDWWNLYHYPLDDGPDTGPAVPVPVARVDGDIGTPPWVFGMSRWAALEDGRVVVAVSQGGLDQLALVDGDGPGARLLRTPFTALASVVAFGRGAAAVAAGPRLEPGVVALGIPGPGDDEPLVADVRPPRDLGLDPAWFSVPEPLTVGTGERTAHALVYPPTNPDVVAPADGAPPLLIFIHGGPTGAARPQLQLGVQFWTSRGFAVADVNYRGSVGYGRRYRDALRGAWGVVDVDDCAAVAEALADRGRADRDALLIRGGSAGGFTVLRALIDHDTFAAGTTLYGVSDLEALARDTHKFEARYLDGLIGAWPEDRATYEERSPLHHADRIHVPLLVLQGLEDEVVPPSQSEAIVAALRGRGVPVAYLAFEGEQHGFRRASTIQRALDAERYFYERVLGLDADHGSGEAPVDIENLPEGA